MRIKTICSLQTRKAMACARNRANQPWMKSSTCRTPHTWVYRMSPLWVSYRSMTSGLSLKLYLIRWCIIETSSGLPRKSSAIFGNLRKSSEILGKCSGTFVWYSEQFWKIFGNLRKVVGNLRKIIKTPSSACLYNKKNITRRLEDMNFIFSWQKQYFTHSLRSFVKYCFATRK